MNQPKNSKLYKIARYSNFVWGEAHNYSGHLTGQRKYIYQKVRFRGFLLDGLMMIFIIGLIGGWKIPALRYSLISLIIVLFIFNIVRRARLIKSGMSGHQLFLEEEQIQNKK